MKYFYILIINFKFAIIFIPSNLHNYNLQYKLTSNFKEKELKGFYLTKIRLNTFFVENLQVFGTAEKKSVEFLKKTKGAKNLKVFGTEENILQIF